MARNKALRPYSRKSTFGYWALAGVLIVFGAVAIFSVGLPFLTIGVALMILAPWRGRPAVFRPPLAGIVAFFIGYVLVAPARCTFTATFPGGPPSTICSNVLGLEYSGEGVYNPPLWPALFAGVALAIAATVATRGLLRRRKKVTARDGAR